MVALAALVSGVDTARPAAGGAPCVIVEGTGIGTLRIGQRVAEALAAAGGVTQERPAGRETLYTLRAPWAELAVVGGRVERISTRSRECRTARGLGVGSSAAAVRAAYASEPASVVVAVAGGDLLSYPFAGIRFLLSGDRVVAVEVLPAERLSRTPSTPTPAATATPGAPGVASPAATGWTLGRLSATVDNLILVVSGVVTNRGRAQAAYAEVRALGPDGVPVAQGDAPLVPTPVPAGGTATFEVRLAIDTVVRRYVVTIRPAGSLTASLADAAGEITNLQQFAGIVARQLQIAVAVQATPPTGDDFLVVVTNGSGVVVASVAVAAEVTVTCRIAVPTPRIIQEVRTGSAVVVQIRPGGQGRAPLPLSPGACAGFATWTASTRVGEVRIGE
ncbi:MAG: hypothetical protein QN183_02690 [Armatimonadota bacterium]|nr:hypothetical protein [Armatimonadota bacterium]MDR7532332.1 hypothetical protein [Armatimonadota bacterium]MDR7535259.1 hypothetical protein [Armatimonadota bacterium]